LFFVQSGLGAITVILSNAWLSVLLHLGDSMFMLAAYIVLWVNARSVGMQTSDTPNKSGLTLFEALLATLLAFTVAMIGAAVQGNGATKACVGWPLCMGQVWPVDQGPYQVLNMVHRLAAGALGLAILYLIWRAWQTARPVLRVSLAAALIIYVLQAAIGAAVVLLNDQIWFVIAQSLHVTFAAATWSTMVTVSAIVWLQQQSNRPATSKAKRVGVSSAPISN
ncbi:MAG: COX15/CtaA family protein, partial [Chloroflexota bacterium]